LTYLFDGEEYDRVLCELYDYCVDNEVPITAHCVMNGIEAYPGASFHFGRAKFWDLVLRQDKYKNLCLNLAHFGWNQASNQGYAGDGSWVIELCDLMVRYENVFADISHHRVLDKRGRKQFVAGYRELQKDFPNDIEKIKKRILYGSDWHVLRRIGGYREFLKNYVRVLEKAGLYDQTTLDRFRGVNALEFLGLLPGGMNHQRLDRFYQSNGINPPSWFP